MRGSWSAPTASFARRRNGGTRAVPRKAAIAVRLLLVLEPTSRWTAEFDTYIRPERGFAACPTHDDLTLVVAGWPYAEFAANKADIEGNYLKTLELAPAFADRVYGATREDRFYGMAVPNYFRRPYGPGWALVGDAGYNKDFITAQGISDAFRDAELCADRLTQVFSGDRSFDDAMSDYQRLRDEHVLPIYEMTTQLATLEPPPPDMQQLLGAIHGNQAAMDGFVRANAGVNFPAEFFSDDNIAQIFASTSSRAAIDRNSLPIRSVKGRDREPPRLPGENPLSVPWSRRPARVPLEIGEAGAGAVTGVCRAQVVERGAVVDGIGGVVEHIVVLTYRRPKSPGTVHRPRQRQQPGSDSHTSGDDGRGPSRSSTTGRFSSPGGGDPLLLRSRPDRRALPVDRDDGLVTDHPGVVTRRQRGDLAGTTVDFGAVLHHHVDPPGDLVLLVRGHAQFGARDRLDVLGPLPARLHGDPTNLGPSGQVQQFQPPLLTLADLVRLVE